MNETTELIALPPKETALQVYSAPQGLDPYLAKIKEELDAFVAGGMTEECAKLAVTLIAKKAIPAVSITY